MLIFSSHILKKTTQTQKPQSICCDTACSVSLALVVRLHHHGSDVSIVSGANPDRSEVATTWSKMLKVDSVGEWTPTIYALSECV